VLEIDKMGVASSTPRNITIPNDAGIVHVTENLAEQLRSRLDEELRHPPPPPPPAATPAPPSPAPAPVAPPPEPVAPPPPPPPQPTPVPHTPTPAEHWAGAYDTEARRAVLRTQAEQQQALAAVERRWQQRQQDRERAFVETQQLQVSEAERVASEVASLLPPSVAPQQQCRGALAAVSECYAARQSRPLECAAVVAAYQQCVQGVSKGVGERKQG